MNSSSKGSQTTVTARGGSDGRTDDRTALGRAGKRTVLRRKFSFLSILSFSCTVLATWEGAFTTIFTIAFVNGGPAGSIYGFLLAWVGTFATFACLSELASMAPTSGGQYHWVSMLAPRRSQKFLGYLAGWLTVCGWQGAAVSAADFVATLIQGLVVLTHPEYEPKRWQTVLLLWATILFAVVINVLAGDLLPNFESLMLILHILGFFAILLPLLVLGERQSASQVFGLFLNNGDWPTQGLSFLLGLTGSVYAFVGGDAAFHMSEEIHNAPVIVPRSVLFSIMLNGLLGFAMVLVTQFCVSDIEAALASPTGFPFMALFLQATNNSVAGATTMAAIITTISLSTTAGLVASASRQLWSFARDRALPGWNALRRVDKRTSVPVRAVALTATVSCLLALINLGSSVALSALFSIATAGLYASYLLAVSLLLYRRCTGGIRMLADDSVHGAPNTIGGQPVWGPWRMPSLLGIVANVFSCMYLTLTLFFTFWPPSTPATAMSMNYSSVVVGGVLILSVVYYLIWARKVYTGPIIELI